MLAAPVSNAGGVFVRERVRRPGDQISVRAELGRSGSVRIPRGHVVVTGGYGHGRSRYRRLFTLAEA